MAPSIPNVRARKVRTLLIALGGLVFSVADTFGQFGHGALFFPAEIVGVLLLYLGVAGSSELPARHGVSRSV